MKERTYFYQTWRRHTLYSLDFATATKQEIIQRPLLGNKSRLQHQKTSEQCFLWGLRREIINCIKLTPVPGGYKYGNLGLQVGGVSDETVKYGYGFCATRAIEWLHCKLQTRPIVREGIPQKQDRKFQTATFRQEVISGRKSHKGAGYEDILTEWPSVVKTSTSTEVDFEFTSVQFVTR
jgi:hypothetical protein